jgi:DNA-binding beta-propeller fold protein YncE
MILSQPDMGASAPRYRIPGSTPANRARFVAALMLPGAFALVPRAAQANPFVDLTWLSGFGKNGTSLEAATAVAFDPIRGEIAIANSGRGRIEILSADGKALAFFEHRVWRPDGSYVLGQPRGLRFDPAGHLLVTDNFDSGVDILDFRGRSIGRLRIPTEGKSGAEVDTMAGALLPLKDGSVLVGTRGEPARIHHFGPTGRWLGAWGVAGPAPGQISRITALAQTPSGDILVGCSGTDLAIQRFDFNGLYVAGFGRHEIGPGNFSYPSGIAVTANGRIWASDELRQCVSVFNAQGEFLGMAGEGGNSKGSFLYPSDVTTDGKGRLAVVERVGGRVQVFRILDVDPEFRAPEGR